MLLSPGVRRARIRVAMASPMLRELQFALGPRCEDHWRPADTFRFEVDSDFDAVGNFDKRNHFVHPVILTVEGHCPFDRCQSLSLYL